jgi:hypothetical protein
MALEDDQMQVVSVSAQQAHAANGVRPSTSQLHRTAQLHRLCRRPATCGSLSVPRTARQHPPNLRPATARQVWVAEHSPDYRERRHAHGTHSHSPSRVQSAPVSRQDGTPVHPSCTRLHVYQQLFTRLVAPLPERGMQASRGDTQGGDASLSTPGAPQLAIVV